MVLGDGTPDEAVQVPAPHQFTGASTYTVTLTVSNPQGFVSRSRTVSLTSAPTPPPVAGFYGTPIGSAPQVTGGGSGGAVIQGVRNTRVDFTNISSGASAYSWAFRGWSTSTQDAPQHQYSSMGTFSVV